MSVITSGIILMPIDTLYRDNHIGNIYQFSSIKRHGYLLQIIKESHEYSVVKEVQCESIEIAKAEFSHHVQGGK